MRLIVRLILTALVFVWVLPLFGGVDFHGNFFTALLLSILFGLMLWVVDALAIMLSAIIAVGTWGFALLWLIPLWIFGFWLLPAVALKAVSDFLPGYLTIHGWMPAIVGGLLLMLISIVTSGSSRRDRRAY